MKKLLNMRVSINFESFSENIYFGQSIPVSLRVLISGLLSFNFFLPKLTKSTPQL